jgi:hypothetical protein
VTLYGLALFLHVAGVICLFVLTGIEWAGMLAKRRAQTIEEIRAWSWVDRASGGLFFHATLLTLIPGLYLAQARWGWTLPWIDASLVILIVISASGPIVNKPRFMKVHMAAGRAGHGPVPAEVSDLVNDSVLWASVHCNGTLMVGMVYIMILKSGMLDTILAVAVTLAAGIASSRMVLGRAASPKPALRPETSPSRTL